MGHVSLIPASQLYWRGIQIFSLAIIEENFKVNNKTSSDSDGDIKIDPNKSNEQYIAEVEKSYIVPSLVRNKFPDLVKLIYETESMNHESSWNREGR